MIKKILILSLLLSACVSITEPVSTIGAGWEDKELIYASSPQEYRYPFKVLLPNTAKISFGPSEIATILNNTKQEFFVFEIKKIHSKTLEEGLTAICKNSKKLREFETILINHNSQYSYYLIKSPCSAIDNYAVLINGEYFYFSMYDDYRESTEPVLRYIIENLKVTE